MFSLYTESFPEQARFISFVEGFMGRFISGTSSSLSLSLFIFLSCLFWGACSSSKTTRVVSNGIPASVILCVAPLSTCSSSLNVSLEVGKTQPFSATARTTANGIESESFSYQSSNPSVLTIASNGNACAGTWDSLTLPQICTPGTTGTAQIIATAQGVSSPPVTVYVHQHITSITISKVPTQPPTLSTT